MKKVLFILLLLCGVANAEPLNITVGKVTTIAGTKGVATFKIIVLKEMGATFNLSKDNFTLQEVFFKKDVTSRFNFKVNDYGGGLYYITIIPFEIWQKGEYSFVFTIFDGWDAGTFCQQIFLN